VIDQHGNEWLPVADAAGAVGVRPGLIRLWAHRGRIISFHHAGRLAVEMGSVRRAERDLRVNGPRPGRARDSR